MYATNIRLHQRHPLPVPTVGVLRVDAPKKRPKSAFSGLQVYFLFSALGLWLKNEIWGSNTTLKRSMRTNFRSFLKTFFRFWPVFVKITSSFSARSTHFRSDLRSFVSMRKKIHRRSFRCTYYFQKVPKQRKFREARLLYMYFSEK